MKCKVCEKEFDNLGPHLKVHKTTAEKYREMYPGSEVTPKWILDMHRKTIVESVDCKHRDDVDRINCEENIKTFSHIEQDCFGYRTICVGNLCKLLLGPKGRFGINLLDGRSLLPNQKKYEVAKKAFDDFENGIRNIETRTWPESSRKRKSEFTKRWNKDRVGKGIHQFQLHPEIGIKGSKAASDKYWNSPNREELRKKNLEKLQKARCTRKNGFFFSNKMQKDFFYRSIYELMYLMSLEINETVSSFDMESCSVEYEWEGKRHETVPDFVVHYFSGITELVEVKALWAFEDDCTICKLRAMQKYAKENNMRFRIITEKDLFQNKNLEAIYSRMLDSNVSVCNMQDYYAIKNGESRELEMALK